MTDDLGAELDAIWSDDLLARRSEAGVLSDYLECVSARRTEREDFRSFTLAVDVGYGEGKSFFLRRFARHMALSHPVAFVDAWADDVLDTPLTALAATLQSALDPLKGEKEVASKLSGVLGKVGEVAKIVTIGAMKRGAAFLITEGAVDAATEAFAKAPENVEGAAKAAAAVGDDFVDASVAAFSGIAPHKLMQDRIESFEGGKAAISDLKVNLSALVSTLEGQKLKPPIVIIVDELDRCRPTYALKLLEEIKHLFDVPGIIFVFGMHGEQLAHAVSSAYGAGFDGKAYLRRFIGRRFKLKEPNLLPLVKKLMTEAGITQHQVTPYFGVSVGRFGDQAIDLDDLVARYMQLYGLPVRDAYTVVDMLQTCVALSRGEVLYAPYLLPLLMSRLKGAEGGDLVQPIKDGEWEFVARDSVIRGSAASTHSPWSMAKKLDAVFKLSPQEFMKQAGKQTDVINDIAFHMRGGKAGLNDPSRYGDLLDAVGRFSGSPQRA